MSFTSLKLKNRSQVANSFFKITLMHASAYVVTELGMLSLLSLYHIDLGQHQTICLNSSLQKHCKLLLPFLAFKIQ